MRQIAILLAACVLLPGCQKARVDALEQRVATLENTVNELKQQQSGEGGDPAQKKIEAMQKVYDFAKKLNERTYRADASLPKGQGAIEVLIVPRGEAQDESTAQNYAKALENINAKGLESVSGVQVSIGEKTYGKTSGKGPLRLPALAAGNYEMTLKLAGFEDRAYPVEVREGQVKQVVTFMLKPGEAQRTQESLSKLLDQYKGGGAEAPGAVAAPDAPAPTLPAAPVKP